MVTNADVDIEETENPLKELTDKELEDARNGILDGRDYSELSEEEQQNIEPYDSEQVRRARARRQAFVEGLNQIESTIKEVKTIVDESSHGLQGGKEKSPYLCC